MEDDISARMMIRRRPWSWLRKINLVICLIVIAVSLTTVIFPISLWFLEGTLLAFIPWMIGNMIYEQRKMRRFKREIRQHELEYERRWGKGEP